MDDTPRDSRHADSEFPNADWWPSNFVENFQGVSLFSRDEKSSTRSPAFNAEKVEVPLLSASQTLWSTGTLSGPIPNGFYSVVPDKKIKELFDTIPTPDDLFALGTEGLKGEIILVDLEKDKKLSMLKHLSAALVKGLNSNPALLIKKIAGLVFNFYKRPNPELSPAKASFEELSQLMENRGVRLLGQIKHGSCRPRAILFKVLADYVGLESKLVVGLSADGSVEGSDSYKHMSVVVVLNSVELLVDLMRFPGQLIPFSNKAIIVSHISAAGESDSAENDSCDSPLEPNSPLCSDKTDHESFPEHDENLQSMYQPRAQPTSNRTGPALRNIMLRSTTSIERKMSACHSEPNIANAFWRRSRRKAVAEQQRTASSSPEHPHSKARGRSILGGDRQSFREYSGVAAGSRSDGASASETRRIRRRSISITPEIGDDIVRAVRAMNETLKQNRLLGDLGADRSDLLTGNGSPNDQIKHDECNVSSWKKKDCSQKALSLPSSPHDLRDITAENVEGTEDLESIWNKVLKSSAFQNRPVLPFDEWSIDFSELTVGTRVGIGFFGEVFRGIWNGTDVAIKVFLEQDLTAENMQDFCNEISILSRLRHPNVILFLGACLKPPRLSFVTEYMEMGSLYYLLHTSAQTTRLNWRRRLKMLRDVCRGLMCLHRMKIVHRDLKSANCLVNKHWTVKICDFGLSRVTSDARVRDDDDDDDDDSSAGTPEWMAPELMRREPFTEKCDVFSLGVIIWELCTLRRPWEGVPPVQVVHAVAHEGTRLDLPDGPLGKLIADCWAVPNERPSCQEILTRLLDCEYALC